LSESLEYREKLLFRENLVTAKEQNFSVCMNMVHPHMTRIKGVEKTCGGRDTRKNEKNIEK
jgi:hypothetical protein